MIHAPDDTSPPSFADRALEQLRTWRALELRQGETGITVHRPGSAAHLARLGCRDEAELCLTWPVIQRLSDALAGDGRVRAEPGSDWVRIPLLSDSDVRLLLVLMSLAIRGTG
ncbi:MAG TPA: luciferase family protein [Streptosporangiaceae bacterium]